MEVLSFFVNVQVVLVSDDYLVCSVECSDASGVEFVGVSDVDAVEVESEEQADAGGRAVHQASVELVLVSVVHESGVDVAAPSLEVGAHDCVQSQLVTWLSEADVVAALHHEGWVDGYLVRLVVAELDGRSEQMDGTHACVPQILVCVAKADIEVEGVAFDVVLCEGRVSGVDEVELRAVEPYIL